MTKPILTTTDLSSYGKTARLILAEKNVDYDLHKVEFMSLGEEDYRAVHHPFAKVPAFRHGDVHLYETAAIAQYVDEVFEGPSLQPVDPVARAQMRKWICVADAYVYPSAITGLVMERVVAPMNEVEANEELIAAALPEIARVLDVIEHELADREYLVGSLSIADFFNATMLSFLSLAPEGASLLEGREAVSAWIARMTERESYAQAA
jgi:glutathione S-transferase